MTPKITKFVIFGVVCSIGEIMNKKVLKTMISLVLLFLFGLYIVKIFFPQEFVVAVENETIINIGNYIQSNLWADYLFGGISSFITYWLYCCAVGKRWYLKWWHNLVIVLVIIINILLSTYDANLYTAFSISTFVTLPVIFGTRDLLPIAICYPIHLISQSLTLSIRNIAVYMTQVNVLTIHILGIESLFWLILLYVYYNYKKEVK